MAKSQPPKKTRLTAKKTKKKMDVRLIGLAGRALAIVP